MMDDDLDDLFAVARGTVPQPSAALMARILADAVAEQPRPATRPVPRLVPVRFSLRALIAALGGMGAMAGLATAAVAGVWIGLTPPTVVDDLAATLWTVDEGDQVDLFPDLEGLIDDAEG